MSPPNASDEGSCWDAAVAVDDVDDVDTGDDTPNSRAEVAEVLACAWSAADCVVGGGGAREGSALGLEGLLPVTGLHTPELSSGQRKTSMGPRVLFSDTW